VKGLVIVAEDSLIVEALAIALRRSGEFRLVGHVNGRRASVQKIHEASPEVVLVDEMDPPDETVALIREIKAERAEISVIVLTLSPNSESLDAFFDAGAIGAISKAADPTAISTLIRETLDGRVLHLHRPPGRVASPSATQPVAENSLLSAREREVLELVAAGSTNLDIARKLWVTEQTVKFHLSNIYRKLGVANRTEASRYAHVNGLVGGSQPAGGG